MSCTTVDADHPQATHGGCNHRSTAACASDDPGLPRHVPGESPDCQEVDCVYLAAPQPATVEAGDGPPVAVIAEQTLAAARRVASSTAEDRAPDPPLEAGMLRALRQEWQV